MAMGLMSSELQLGPASLQDGLLRHMTSLVYDDVACCFMIVYIRQNVKIRERENEQNTCMCVCVCVYYILYIIIENHIHTSAYGVGHILIVSCKYIINICLQS